MDTSGAGWRDRDRALKAIRKIMDEIEYPEIEDSDDILDDFDGEEEFEEEGDFINEDE